jgi:class 3 adenylate cyclase
MESPDLTKKQEKSRTLQMLKLYWELEKQIVFHQTSAPIGFTPHPLLSLIVNLRKKMGKCFEQLSEVERIKPALGAMEDLFDTVLSGEPDTLSVVPEWVTEEIHKVEIFLAEAEISLKPSQYPLTQEEELFLEHAKSEIDNYKKRVKDTFDKKLEKLKQSTSSQWQNAQEENGKSTSQSESYFIFFKDAAIRPKNSNPPVEGYGAVIVECDEISGENVLSAFHDEYPDSPELVLISSSSMTPAQILRARKWAEIVAHDAIVFPISNIVTDTWHVLLDWGEKIEEVIKFKKRNKSSPSIKDGETQSSVSSEAENTSETAAKNGGSGMSNKPLWKKKARTGPHTMPDGTTLTGEEVIRAWPEDLRGAIDKFEPLEEIEKIITDELTKQNSQIKATAPLGAQMEMEDGKVKEQECEEISEKYVVEIDLCRYSDIARLLQEEHELGAKATEWLDKQIFKFVKDAAQTQDMELEKIPHSQIGDAVIIAFSSAYESVKFAEAFQLSTIEYNSSKNTELSQRHFRVGIAKGEIIIKRMLTPGGEFKDYKLSGTPIAHAKRLESNCKINEVLICSETFSDLTKDIQTAFGIEEKVKGKRKEIFKAHRRKVVRIAPAEKITRDYEENKSIDDVILADDLVIRDIELDYGVKVSENNSISGCDAVTGIFSKTKETIYLEVSYHEQLDDCDFNSISGITSYFLSRSKTIAEEIPKRPISCVLALVSNFVSKEQEDEAYKKIVEALQDSPIPTEVRVYQFELLKNKFIIL